MAKSKTKNVAEETKVKVETPETEAVKVEKEDELWPAARKAVILDFLLLYAGFFLPGMIAVVRFMLFTLKGEFDLTPLMFAFACYGMFSLVRLLYVKVFAKTIECPFLEAKFLDL